MKFVLGKDAQIADEEAKLAELKNSVDIQDRISTFWEVFDTDGTKIGQVVGSASLDQVQDLVNAGVFNRYTFTNPRNLTYRRIITVDAAGL